MKKRETDMKLEEEWLEENSTKFKIQFILQFFEREKINLNFRSKWKNGEPQKCFLVS